LRIATEISVNRHLCNYLAPSEGSRGSCRRTSARRQSGPFIYFLLFTDVIRK